MPRWSRVLLAALALVLAGCGDDGDDGGSGGEGAPSSSTAISILATPEEAARCLFDAWIDSDLAAARRCADDIAVDELFARSVGQRSLTFEGCTEEGQTAQCTWAGERDLAMLAAASETYGWRVSDVDNDAD
jgi:hypothetical protein